MSVILKTRIPPIVHWNFVVRIQCKESLLWTSTNDKLVCLGPV